MAGYSKKSLKDKLGLKDGAVALFLNEPQTYLKDLGDVSEITIDQTSNKDSYDFIHFFTKSKNDLEIEFPKLKKLLHKQGLLWISWPKITSKAPTDLNENMVMKIGLENGLVDIKVLAIDEIWSGLKFVYRINDR